MSIYERFNYDENVLIVRKYGEHKYKISMLSSCRIAGMEKAIDESIPVKKNTVNTEKLNCNLSRAKNRVWELAICNEWDYWCTFTLSPDKYDRYNLQTYARHFSEFIHNQNKRRKEKIRYLLIPEIHEDGAWHIHGFIYGIPKDEIVVNQYGYKTWTKYENKFGYISMSEIQDRDKCASYSMKYMTKDTSKNVTDLGAHLYYASQNLNKSELIYKGHGCIHGEWDWEHPDGYCRIKTIDDRETNLEEIVEVLA